MLKVIDLLDTNPALDYDHLIAFDIQTSISVMMITFAKSSQRWRKVPVEERESYLKENLDQVYRFCLDIDLTVELMQSDDNDEYVVTALTKEGHPIMSYSSENVSRKARITTIDHYDYYENWYK